MSEINNISNVLEERELDDEDLQGIFGQCELEQVVSQEF